MREKSQAKRKNDEGGTRPWAAPRAIIHADMDAFFASVEQRDNPPLKGKPIIVGQVGSQRGVVTSASYEARPSGVYAGMSLWQAKRLCPQATFVQGRMRVYVREGRRAFRVFREHTPTVQPTSIDEAFLDVTGCISALGPPEQIARRIKKRIWEELKLTVSLGLAPNKLVAKIASDWHKPDGLTVVRQEELPEALWPLPVGKLWGLGPRTGERLERLGVHTVGDLARLPPALLDREFGVYGQHLHRAAHGEDDEPVVPYYEATLAKSVSHETTFEDDVGDVRVLKRHLLALSQRVGRRLRDEGYQGSTVTLKLRYADFRTITRQQKVQAPTDLDPEIYQGAARLLDALHLTDASRVRLVGVAVSGLTRSGAPYQFGLPGVGKRSAAWPKVLRAVDKVRDRFGEESVVPAALIDRKTKPRSSRVQGTRERGKASAGLRSPIRRARSGQDTSD